MLLLLAMNGVLNLEDRNTKQDHYVILFHVVSYFVMGVYILKPNSLMHVYLSEAVDLIARCGWPVWSAAQGYVRLPSAKYIQVPSSDE